MLARYFANQSLCCACTECCICHENARHRSQCRGALGLVSRMLRGRSLAALKCRVVEPRRQSVIVACVTTHLWHLQDCLGKRASAALEKYTVPFALDYTYERCSILDNPSIHLCLMMEDTMNFPDFWCRASTILRGRSTWRCAIRSFRKSKHTDKL